MKVQRLRATLGPWALCLIVQAASAGDRPNGVVGNTLCLNADPKGVLGTYALIESVLGTGAVEAPSDGVSVPNRPHIISMPEDSFVGPYFSFLANEPNDVNLDRLTLSEGGDRSRTEIKIAPSAGGVHQPFKAREGDTFVYTWRFKISTGMKFSPSFTHLHQIKAYGGNFSDSPLITFTPLSNGLMEIRYLGNVKTNSATYQKIYTVELSQLRGQWLDVREQITFSNTAGRYQLSIIDQHGRQVVAVDQSGLELWRQGADHIRPKWGIYRRHHSTLNQNVDDSVDFANFGITRGMQPDSSCR